MEIEDNHQQKRQTMSTERQILLRLTEILEKEQLITPAESNQVICLIEREGTP